MLSAEKQLELLYALEDTVDACDTMAQAYDALGRVLASRTGLTEVLVLRADPPPQLIADDAAQYSEEVRALARTLANAAASWERTSWDDCLALAIPGKKARIGYLVARRPGGLTTADEDLLDYAAKRLSRSVAHLADRETLMDRNLELATVYEIDRIRDQHYDFDEMVSRIMNRMLEIIPADVAMLVLGDNLDVAQRFVRSPAGEEAAHRVSERYAADLDPLLKDLYSMQRPADLSVGEPKRAVCAVPLILRGQSIGAFLLIGREGRSFSPRDVRLFRAVCSQTDTAIFEDVKQQELKDVFSRYVSRDVFSQMLDSHDDFMIGRRSDVTCLFSDLRGFTSVSEELPVDTVVEMLNEHFEAMTAVVFKMGGTVDKFIGDCVMAFFGAPLDAPDHVEKAVRCAALMRDTHNVLCERWTARGLPAAKIGIGVHTGPVFVGPIGGENLVSYTVIGDNVNLASRLEGISHGDDVLISGPVYDVVKDWVEVESRGDITVKGRSVPTAVYNVTSIKG